MGDIKKMSGSLLPVGILALVGMLVLPLPVVLLDMFFVFNITISLLILMVALHTHRPLDFSSFPNLLLLATVLRLGLNVASTRIVLSEGHNGVDAAGKVIQAFGEFIVAGNYAVGLFVFAILVIINLVVITKGAGRVSEVSARFTLDAMPGKQMAIDADLNAGVLTPEEATDRRADVSKEADFYGSMDGASKFVKGDAIAGILILAINVIGGLIIGIAQHDLNVTQAAEFYVLLSIGDGLVAQIPSLLLSIATAIIVTRVSSSENMSEHITRQVNLSAAWLPTSLVMLALGLVPGMPNILFIGFAVITGIFAWNSRRKEVAALSGEVIAEGGEDLTEEVEFGLVDVKDASKISVNIGYGLVPLVDEGKADNLVPKVTRLRKEISKALGFIVPGVRIRDDLNLEASQYQIKIGQKIVADDLIYADKKLAIASDSTNLELSGLKVKEPAFGVDAYWIDKELQADAEAKGYVIVEPDDVLTTHLNQIINSYSSDLLGQEEVQELLDNLKVSYPNLVDTVVPKVMPLNQVTSVMKCILEEGVPISDLRLILESLSSMNIQKMDSDDIAERIRPKLVPLLIQKLLKFKDTIPLITFSPELEQMILTTVRQNPDEKMLLIEGTLAKKILSNLNEASEQFNSEGKPVFLIVAPQIRKHVARFVRSQLPSINVLSFLELPEDRSVEIAFTVGGLDAIE
ncbi:flagellar biosynthesis protein FlhA [Planktomarina temperata]|nr:flagellar biosynthesis protein FlhA [Planktomarina temperata]MDA8751324.1 flagellar biosynthesis protein FlhA [Planktomarina temperata]MDA9152470.1 flagellar biosynthesis protein FlhA [Planktomarina temperata]MDA9254928.1 flagellar biosynthesis protein FlhA [Planktomarina temperata]MDB9749398.1 flagellar biosynthesis protein FlhA [Planktomarina temperata]